MPQGQKDNDADNEEFFKKSPFARLFCTPDFQSKAQKQATALSFGLYGGFVSGVVSTLLTPEMTFQELVLKKKRWFVFQLLKGTFVGGLCSSAYMGTVLTLSHQRGNKDDWINHFVGGYSGVLPYAIIYNKDWRFLMISGTIWGFIFAIAKLTGSSEAILPVYKHRNERLGQTKYPELYIYAEARNEMQRMREEGHIKLW